MKLANNVYTATSTGVLILITIIKSLNLKYEISLDLKVLITEWRARYIILYFHAYFKGLLKELIKNCDGSLKAEVTQAAAYYEHRLQLGTKAIYHLEAFVAKFMSIYKRFLEEGMMDMM